MNTQMTDKELKALRMLGAYLPYCECGLRAKGALEIYLDVWRASDMGMFGAWFHDKKADENAQRDVDPSALLTDFESYEANGKAWADLDLNESLEALIKGVKGLGELQARQIDEYEHAFKLKLEAFQALLKDALKFTKKSQISLGVYGKKIYIIEAEALLNRAREMLEFLIFPLDAKAEYEVLSNQIAKAQNSAYLAYEYFIKVIPDFPIGLPELPDVAWKILCCPLNAASVLLRLSPGYSNIISEIKESQSRIEASLQILSDITQKLTNIQEASRYQAKTRAVEVIKILEDFKESVNQSQASQAQSVSALKAVSAWLVSLLEIPSKIRDNQQNSYMEQFLATRERVYESFRQFDESNLAK